jgi:hypothetical protein
MVWLAMSVVPVAHHGLTQFDQTTPVTLTGTVTAFHFVTPHAVVEFEVKDESGQTQVWQGQLTSRGNLNLRGWTATSLEAGNVVTVTGYRAKNGSLYLWVTALSSSNGTRLRGA